ERLFMKEHGNHWILLVAKPQEKTVSILDSLHHQNFKWLNLWGQFFDLRNKAANVKEQLGPWTYSPMQSNKQKDSNSCGVFTLMRFIRNTAMGTMFCVWQVVPPEVLWSASKGSP
ncbi:hypothetical protein DPMN_136611, partial [Dreissena polymorpha]